MRNLYLLRVDHNMYTVENPAPDIQTLLDYLKGEHIEGDLYRGQSIEYPALIPSTFRDAIVKETANKPIVTINTDIFYAGLKSDSQRNLRYTVVHDLISELGITLGNIVSQQYGLTSEALDVSESPDVAAFFATRAWSEYHHISDTETGIGVLYRFRPNLEMGYPKSLDLHMLDSYLEMGVYDGVYFDFFVHEDRLDAVFDRDKWMGFIRSKDAIVSTMPLTIRWQDILKIVEQARANMKEKGQGKRKVLQNMVGAEWHNSRIAVQKGSIIRPVFYWKSNIPETYKLWDPENGISYPGGEGFLNFGSGDDGLPWPRAVPSLAIKKQLIGVENVRHREECEVFYFKHGSTKVTSLYRRDMWPEPSEDPLYGNVWNFATYHMMRANRMSLMMPAIDDPEEGLLDRGYRVAGEKQTRNAREIDDWMRGQLEDAQEVFELGEVTDHDYARAIEALRYLNRGQEALEKANEGLEIFPDSMELLLSMFALQFQRSNQQKVSELAHKAHELYPDHPRTLYAMAVVEEGSKNYDVAHEYITEAIENYDLVLHSRTLPEYLLIKLGAIIAGLRNDKNKMMTLLIRLSDMGYDAGEVDSIIRRLRKEQGLD